MLLECPTRHRPRRRPGPLGGRHRRRQRPVRQALNCGATAPIRQEPDGLTGSFDPVWTAGAEARFIHGALRSPSRHPLATAGRVLVLVALLAPAAAPMLNAMRAGSAFSQATTVAAAVAVVVVAARAFGRGRV